MLRAPTQPKESSVWHQQTLQSLFKIQTQVQDTAECMGLWGMGTRICPLAPFPGVLGSADRHLSVGGWAHVSGSAQKEETLLSVLGGAHSEGVGKMSSEASWRTQLPSTLLGESSLGRLSGAG